MHALELLQWVAELLATTLYLFAPAAAANVTPPVAARLFPQYGAPVWARVLGKNKTWRGLGAGAFVGAVVLTMQAEVVPLVPWVGDAVLGLEILPYRECSTAQAALVGALFGSLALVGDAAESAVKRSLAKPPGTPWWPDRIDWIVPLAPALYLMVGGQVFGYVASMMLFALFAHRAFCIAFHSVGLKEVPH